LSLGYLLEARSGLGKRMPVSLEIDTMTKM
jgi:hypothetical protein